MYSRNQISIKGNFSGKSLCIGSRFTEVQPLYSGYQLSARRHRQLRHTNQGPVTVPPSRLGASVQRANRPELGAFTSPCGTAISISGFGLGATLTARLLSRLVPIKLLGKLLVSIRYAFHHEQDRRHSICKECCFVKNVVLL